MNAMNSPRGWLQGATLRGRPPRAARSHSTSESSPAPTNRGPRRQLGRSNGAEELSRPAETYVRETLEILRTVPA